MRSYVRKVFERAKELEFYYVIETELFILEYQKQPHQIKLYESLNIYCCLINTSDISCGLVFRDIKISLIPRLRGLKKDKNICNK
jgi:hypothetical protein